MGRKLILLLSIGVFVGVGIVHAQSNEVIDDLLEEQKTSFGLAAYLVLTATGRIPDGTTTEEAVSALSDQGWIIPKRKVEEPLTLGEYAFLLMQAFQVKGGVMYRIFPGPRYAGREFAYLEFIRGNGSPYRNFSGDEALGILGRLLEWKEVQS